MKQLWKIFSEKILIIKYSYGSPHMAGQKQDNQLEHTFSSYVRIWDVALEDLPEVMSDGEKWRERVRDIRASGTTWWWWW